jgi:hypothetical protein
MRCWPERMLWLGAWEKVQLWWEGCGGKGKHKGKWCLIKTIDQIHILFASPLEPFLEDD